MPEHAQEQHNHGGEGKIPPLGLVAFVIFLLLCGYGFLASQGIPQGWTQQAIQAETVEHNEAEKAEIQHPPLYMIAPFALLLLSIAILPLIPTTAHWWETNFHKFCVAAGLGVLTLLYYGFLSDFTLAGHWPAHYEIAADSGTFDKISVIFMNAIVADFIPFIILLFSLFTITGGIRIEGNLKASPLVNSVILFLGAVFASLIGTTGAAMLMIRLLLDTNRERKHKVHTVVFFIFCVCNCGGCLTPLGDPPLFLGYLKGVDFFWTFNLWKEWAFVNCILIAIYFLWDTVWFYPGESKEDKELDTKNQTGLKISGLGLNLPLLVGIVASVAFLSPEKPVLGTNWHPWYFLREAIQLGLCAVSLALGSRKIRQANVFNFAAITEVAALFFGIFICMQAPLQILNVEGKNIVAFAETKTGVEQPKLFFWSTGALSSVLDNAPTYVVFFETAKSLSPNSEDELKASEKFSKLHEAGKMVPVGSGYVEFHLLAAISLGAVFMGAMTYIGNGPNFMVKAIAEQSDVKMPSFFGYMVYSFIFLLPLFFVMTLLFL
ncbi:MAG: sodium:proton antiporter [Planctomycetaceae bacterium]|nr:sodium:proton antiporter [Planctomycetaceae bacterium]MCL2305621.1 sodium:proton antiporter [Planctomycetaceae bacterium]